MTTEHDQDHLRGRTNGKRRHAAGVRTHHLYAAILANTEHRTGMVVIYGTKKLLGRIPTPTTDIDQPAGSLGSWYATVLFWKPKVAQLIDESTYLPLSMPLRRQPPLNGSPTRSRRSSRRTAHRLLSSR